MTKKFNISARAFTFIVMLAMILTALPLTVLTNDLDYPIIPLKQ